MTEAITTLTDLSPLAAVVIIAGVLASISTQVAKRGAWSKGTVELVAVAISVVLGLTAYIVAGVSGVFPASLVSGVSTAAVVIAGVAVTSRAVYALIGHAVPDAKAQTHRADG